MSALAAPQISLEQARQLVVYLENGEQEKADQLIIDAASQEQSELFAEVGKLTRQLHDALKNFELDTRLSDLTTDALPDAKQRLNYVMEMTENAANKTMDAVEASLPIAQELADEIAHIKPTWDRLMSREIELGEFKTLCHSLDKFMSHSHTKTDELQGLMTNVLMAQDFQDLTGQVIRRVIELVRESGFPDDSIFAIGQDLGTEKEIIRKLTLGEVNDDTLTTKYFSILVVKRV